ncbi:aminodeoxychorismate synthase [Lentinula detonsa]|uniref:aminodeoxychorismate synthase n=1 Tax=Lentinula detonsa TaxID=2804962 RepID=A0A9W8P8Z3_9AGAR|nr:aminodeoxychorismate synthase [Lentinula detonsa]
MTIQRPRLLLIDSYDSFTFNLAALCRTAIPECSIHLIKNDQLTIEDLLPLLKSFSAIIIGPGPGSPDLSQDVGVSLVIEHGGQLKRLQVVKHGQVSKIIHTGRDNFKNLKQVTAVRYHSYHAEPDTKEIESLAWADDGVENGSVLMGGKHQTRPFWGVQYHPESVLTDDGGLHILCNFWSLAVEWSQKRDRCLSPLDSSAMKILGPSWPHLRLSSLSSSRSTTTATSVTTSVVQLPGVNVLDICETLGVDDHRSPFILLDSAANPGRFSVIASLLSTSLQSLYSVGDVFVTLKCGKSVQQALRGSQKEVAENLMIVDLIRHDLHGVLGLDVHVKQFCEIEEYETVWQMASVIEGRLPAGTRKDDLGWEVLRQSLPPGEFQSGSMTGAPKKRSVEILQSLEDEDRSLYSGVFGYWCVGGGGDWSVAIRSCFKHELECQDSEVEHWVIGAGGAITALSDPQAEWDEILLKLKVVLGAFGAGNPRCNEC